MSRAADRAGPAGGGAMRTVTLPGAAIILVLAVVGIASLGAAPPAAAPGTGASRTLSFEVQFSPFSLIHVNPLPNPTTGFGLGDELTFHDLLFANGKQVGDEGGSCVIVDIAQ